MQVPRRARRKIGQSVGKIGIAPQSIDPAVVQSTYMSGNMGMDFITNYFD